MTCRLISSSLRVYIHPNHPIIRKAKGFCPFALLWFELFTMGLNPPIARLQITVNPLTPTFLSSLVRSCKACHFRGRLGRSILKVRHRDSEFIRFASLLPIVVVACLFHTLAISSGIFRLTYRWYISRFGWEDIWALLALLTDIGCLTCSWLQRSVPCTFPSSLLPL